MATTQSIVVKVSDVLIKKKDESKISLVTRVAWMGGAFFAAILILIVVAIKISRLTLEIAVSQLAAPMAVLVSAFMVALAAVFTYQSASKARELDRESARNQRFAEACQMVSSDSPYIVIGGLQVLSALANEWQKFGDTENVRRCISVLCAYLKSWPVDERGHAIGKESVSRLSLAPVQSPRLYAVEIIRDHTKKGEVDFRWKGEWINLEYAHLEKSRLDDCCLHGIWLIGAKLQNARFGNTDLAGAWLKNCDAYGTDFSNADLTGVAFSGADLNKANLMGAILNNTRIRRSTIEGTKIYEKDYKRLKESFPDEGYGSCIDGATGNPRLMFPKNVKE